jgi:ABC-type uncharacterized transport system involved in gliding motility auxiliary subunit
MKKLEELLKLLRKYGIQQYKGKLGKEDVTVVLDPVFEQPKDNVEYPSWNNDQFNKEISREEKILSYQNKLMNRM